MWASLWVFLGFIYNAKQITDAVVGGTPYNHSSEQALYNKTPVFFLKDFLNWLYFQFQNHKRIQSGEGAVIVFVFYRFFENFMSFNHIHPPFHSSSQIHHPTSLPTQLCVFLFPPRPVCAAQIFLGVCPSTAM